MQPSASSPITGDHAGHCWHTSGWRRNAHQQRFAKERGAALRVQSTRRMISQRRVYRRELAEKKEEAKLSTQLAKMQKLDAQVDQRFTDARMDLEREIHSCAKLKYQIQY